MTRFTLPTAQNLRNMADNQLADLHGAALGWIETNVTGELIAKAFQYRARVPLYNCGDKLQAAVLASLTAMDYTVEIEPSTHNMMPDTLLITWAVA